MDNFIKIPTNPQDLHSLKELRDAYVAATKFKNNVQEYFTAIMDSHLKTIDQVLSEIPQAKWKKYKMYDYYSKELTEEGKKWLEDNKHMIGELYALPSGLVSGRHIYAKYKNKTLQDFYNDDYEKYKNEKNDNIIVYKEGFFIDHTNKIIKLYSQWSTRFGYNTTFVKSPDFKFINDHEICMTSTKIYRPGTYRRPGDHEEKSSTLYYFDVETNSFICK